MAAGRNPGRESTRRFGGFDGDKPLGLHAAEVGTLVFAQRFFGVENALSAAISDKHDPVPTWTILLDMPLDCQQGKIGQRFPGSKWRLAAMRSKAKVLQESANMISFRPEPFILRVNAQFAGCSLCFFIGKAGDGGYADDAAAGKFTLDDRL